MRTLGIDGGDMLRPKTVIWGYKKSCSGCKEFKPFVEFPKNKAVKCGLGNLCKVCNHKRVNEWIAKQDQESFKRRRCEISVKHVEALKFDVMSHYGPCYCCGEDQLAFLTIDHINGGGNKHKKEIDRYGFRFYKWIKDNNYPNDLRSACMNCNMATRFGKVCPHKEGVV